MVQQQSLGEFEPVQHTATTASAYYGAHDLPGAAINAATFDLDVNQAGAELHRHTYVAQYLFGTNDDALKAGADYGGIQLRARVYTYSGQLTTRMEALLRATAHRAAYLFDTSIQTQGYGYGPGYLTGFEPWQVYQNVEDAEPVTSSEGLPVGAVDWSVEIYLDDDWDTAYLSGIAQGLAYPWNVDRRRSGGQDGYRVPRQVWSLDTYDSRPAYYEIRPPAGTAARDRYREGAGAGKNVYINGHRVGVLDGKGRAWLKKEYARGGPYRGKWDRASLIREDSDVTPQSLRKGGNLYLVDETEEGVYLDTYRRRPADFDAADPDRVLVDQEIREFEPAEDYTVLGLVDGDDPFPFECVRDDELIKHLGKSSPTYEHTLAAAQAWRPVE